MIWPPMMPALVSTLATVLLFPVITFFLVMIHRILPMKPTPY
jgi:hypothetical protein